MIFYFRLARELGYTVGRLLREISSDEITAWMAFLTVEEEERERKRLAANREEIFKQITAATKNAPPAPKKGKK